MAVGDPATNLADPFSGSRMHLIWEDECRFYETSIIAGNFSALLGGRPHGNEGALADIQNKD